MTRDSASPSLPTGTVTFFFSDIEGSTRLLQELGDGYPRVLETQAELIRRVLAETDGVEVATEGDSFFVVFPSAPAAISACAEIQRSLATHPWPEGVTVAVRIGLHTGEGLLVGDNYGGLDVHRAARIGAIAHGGQTVISSATAGLVGSALPEGVELVPLGKHRLKDLVAEEELFQVNVSGLRTEFPPIRSLGSRPNNLPLELTNFIGREKEIDSIIDLLGSKRLVTLTGPGGTGKTRLSLQVAARSLDVFPDGVFVIFLAPITDPALVPGTIAGALGIQEEKTKGIDKTVLAATAGKQMLLVLDNVEQIVEGAAPFVAELLSNAPGVKILATSRAALRISGEHEYSVPPMVLPDPLDLPSVSLLLRYETVALFVERAAAVKTGFMLTEDNATAVVSICKRLDGLPLAIELAAARVRILSPAAISERLESCLGLLTGGGRDLPERQQTLRGAIDWSYDILEETLRRFFARVAIFVNGFTFEAAEEVCDPGGELGIDTLDGLTQLVDNSLIRQYESVDGGSRFRLLQVIREYGLEKLEGADETALLSKRHSDFFVALAEGAEREVAFGDLETMQLVEQEHDNLRAVLARSLDDDDAEPGLRAGASIWRFWMMRSHLKEGRDWLEKLLALPSAATPDRIRARGLDAAAGIAYWQNDYTNVRPYYEQALQIYRDLDDDAGVAAQTYNLGFTLAIEYEDDKALAYLEEAREIFKRIGDLDRESDAIWAWSWISVISGRYEQARPLAEEVLERYLKANNSFGIGSAYLTLCRIDLDAGRMEQGWDRLRAGLDSFRDTRDLGDIASILKISSEFDLVEGRYERSAILWGAGDACEVAYGGGAPEAIVRYKDPRPELIEVLGAERVEELLAEGAALSVAEAIAVAKKEEG